MAINRDDSAERLARIELLLAEAKRTMAQITPKDRVARQELSDQLDEMLNELLGPYERGSSGMTAVTPRPGRKTPTPTSLKLSLLPSATRSF